MEKSLIIKRLSLIKYLFTQGKLQVDKGGVLAGISILALHDSIEMFLMLAYEHIDARSSNKQLTLLNYFSEMPNLVGKESIKSLNDCRNSIKHHGQFPASDDIQKHLITAENFLIENSQIQFDIDFSTVSIIDLVSYEEVKEHLVKAYEYFQKELYYKGAIECRIAFYSLLEEYESNKVKQYKSILNIGKRVHTRSYEKFLKDVTLKQNTKYKEWFNDIESNIQDIKNAVNVIALGIDYRQYCLFMAITPEVIRWAGEKEYQPREYESSFCKRVITNERLATTSIDFVVGCAIKLQDTDYDLSRYLIGTNF